jgi:hypothetical protein
MTAIGGQTRDTWGSFVGSRGPAPVWPRKLQG